MSANRKLLTQFPKGNVIIGKKDPRSYLKEILSFGPLETQPQSSEVTERIKQLVKELEEINRRIDELSNRM